MLLFLPSVLTRHIAGIDFFCLYLCAVMIDGPGGRFQHVSRLARDLFLYMGPDIYLHALFLLFSFDGNRLRDRELILLSGMLIRGNLFPLLISYSLWRVAGNIRM